MTNATIRAKVLERDHWRCRVCGESNPNVHVHHIVFRSHGGPDELWNLITLCKTHHDVAHGLHKGEKLAKWELHALATVMPNRILTLPGIMARTCLTCQHRTYDGCEIWEHPVDWDYFCDAWKIRELE